MFEIEVRIVVVERLASRFHVRVTDDDGSATEHDVTLSAADQERLGADYPDPDAFIRACFTVPARTGAERVDPVRRSTSARSRRTSRAAGARDRAARVPLLGVDQVVLRRELLADRARPPTTTSRQRRKITPESIRIARVRAAPFSTQMKDRINAGMMNPRL